MNYRIWTRKAIFCLAAPFLVVACDDSSSGTSSTSTASRSSTSSALSPTTTALSSTTNSASTTSSSNSGGTSSTSLAPTADTSSTGDATLVGDTSRPNNSTFVAGEDVQLSFHASGLSASQTTEVSIKISDEFGSEISSTAVTITADSSGNATATASAPSKNLGYFHVEATLPDGTPLAAQGTRPTGFITYAIVPDPNTRVNYGDSGSHFGMQGGFSSAQGSVIPYLGIRYVLSDPAWADLEPNSAGQYAQARSTAAAKGQSFPAKDAVTAGVTYNGAAWLTYSVPLVTRAKIPTWALEPGTAGTTCKSMGGLNSLGTLSLPGFADDTRGIKSLVPIFAVCIIVWAVDFRSQTSGGAVAIQGTVMAVFFAASSFLMVSALRQRIGAGPVWLLLLATFLFVIESAVVGVLNGQEGYAIFVNVIPPLIYAIASAITYITLATSQQSRSFLNVLRYSCLTFVIVKVIVVILTRGSINLSESRFEVLSGATIPALAIAAVGFVKPLTKLDVGIFLLDLLVTIISVTRTLLAVLAVQVIIVLALRPSALLKPSTVKGMIVLGASLLIIVGLDLGAGTSLTTRWIERVTVSQQKGADPTSLTRKAEVQFMMNKFSESADTILFGNGLAAVTSLTGPDARLAARLVGERSASMHSVGFGHENYVSILFTGGLLGGGGLIFLLFLNGYQAAILIRRFKVADLHKSENDAHVGLWGALIVIGMIVAGFFSGVLSDRGSALWYGIGTGMLYWSRHHQSRV